MVLLAEMVAEATMVSTVGKEEVNGIWSVPAEEQAAMVEKVEMVGAEEIRRFTIRTLTNSPI